MTRADNPIYSFDESKTLFALASGDGRVRLFNVAQQRLISDITQAVRPQSHGATPIYSCISWGTGVSVTDKVLMTVIAFLELYSSFPLFCRRLVRNSS